VVDAVDAVDEVKEVEELKSPDISGEPMEDNAASNAPTNPHDDDEDMIPEVQQDSRQVEVEAPSEEEAGSPAD
jgi:hypothetical protein